MSSFRDDGALALEWAASYLERVRGLPVLSRVQPGAVRAALPVRAPDTSEPFDAVLRDLDAVLLPGMTHWQSPRYFAYFATTGSEPGILAELLAATLNQVGILWRTSPALQELEEVALAWLADLLGLPAGLHGHIEDSASTGLVTALAAARAAAPDRRVVICSEHTHSSTAKAARLLELELCPLPGDERFAMRLDDLDLTDTCAVVATIGTTSSASIDPVPALADRCAEAGVWLHVDAAYAGSAAVCPELRPLFVGWERADSVGVNPHKWLFTPMDCSAFFCSRPDDLRNAFSLVPEYLRVSEDVVSLSEYSIPLGRRFRALKLWAVLRCYGREGLQAVIREHVRLAALFERWVSDEPGWELCAPRHFSLVCFRRDGPDDVNEALLERVNATGEVFLSHTRLDGRFVLRLAIGNARTTEDDVRLAWDVLRASCA
ncbi:MAG TPA: pyridoxal-dependent decarboxylase [Gaiella sp.]|jgi:aromatic-L-amino-acid decarboxylase|nr:pyridoxal-dependent decarboxylase [Gaiella sp.]